MEKGDKVLRKPEVFEKTGLSDATIWRREHSGDFPRRMSLGGKAVGWLESEIEEWIQKKAEARRV